MVPRLLSHSFSGREDELAQIYRGFAYNPVRRLSLCALWGTLGVGKSQIALCFADRYQDLYTHIFHVRAASSATLLEDYRLIAQRLKLWRPDQTIAQERGEREAVELVKGWLAEHSTWLLIFDNALEASTVRRFTPVDGRGHVIFTTRDEMSAATLADWPNAYEVRPLLFADAVELALRLRGPDNVDLVEKQEAERLAHMVVGLPVAIEQAVCLAIQRKTPLSSILHELTGKLTALGESHPNSMHEDGLSTGAILELALDTLEKESPHANELFKLLVYFDCSSVPIDIITHGSQRLESHFARRSTYERGFVRTSEAVTETRVEAKATRPTFNYHDPFNSSFWRSLISPRKRLSPPAPKNRHAG
jgi:hypothetical protein